MFEKLQNLPINYIDTTSHGDLISRMINDIDIMTDGFLESFATALSGFTTIIGTLIAMFVLNIKLSLIILFITPLSIITSAIIVKNSKIEKVSLGSLEVSEDYTINAGIVCGLSESGSAFEKVGVVNSSVVCTVETKNENVAFSFSSKSG